MKKTILAAAMAISTTAMAEGTTAIDFAPYVGAERETVGDSTVAYVGTGIDLGALNLNAQVDFDLKNDASQRGDVTVIQLDGSYALSKNMSVYAENDLSDSFDRTETKVGVKYTF